MVELKDDLVFVIFGATRPNHVRSEVARKPVRRREATAVTGGSSPLPGSRYSSSSFKEDTPMACTIPPIKSQAFAGDHPTPGQKSRVTPKGDGMNEGAVHLEGFGGAVVSVVAPPDSRGHGFGFYR